MLISQFSKKILHLILYVRLDSQLFLFCNSFFCCKWLYLLQPIFLLQFFFEFLMVDKSECTLIKNSGKIWNSHITVFLKSLRWHFCFTSSLYRVALYFIHQCFVTYIHHCFIRCNFCCSITKNLISNLLNYSDLPNSLLQVLKVLNSSIKCFFFWSWTKIIWFLILIRY